MSNGPLLRWGIENSDTDELHKSIEEKKALRFDPKLVEMILGKDDPVRMRETTDVIVDGSKGLEERLAAFDVLQDLVEQIDNANNMAKMNLWQELLPLLDAPEVELRTNMLRVIALSAKNNREASDYLVEQKLLSRLALTLERETNVLVVRRLIMAMSALCQTENDPDFDEFMQERSASVLESKLSLLMRENVENFNDQISFLFLNYSWFHKTVPKSLQNNDVLYSNFKRLHLEQCDDPECDLPLEHRQQ